MALRGVVPTTDDPNDPRLLRYRSKLGPDTEPTEQQEAYLVLPEEERAKGFVRPVRNAYRHLVCGEVTTMNQAIAETYARNPSFYGGTFCIYCLVHRPIGAEGEFEWLDGSKVGT